MGKLAAKGVGAIVMGIVNPLLAVLPLFKEGKGEDSPCNQLIAQATAMKKQAAKAPSAPSLGPPTASSSGQSAASGATAKRPPSPPAR